MLVDQRCVHRIFSHSTDQCSRPISCLLLLNCSIIKNQFIVPSLLSPVPLHLKVEIYQRWFLSILVSSVFKPHHPRKASQTPLARVAFERSSFPPRSCLPAPHAQLAPRVDSCPHLVGVRAESVSLVGLLAFSLACLSKPRQTMPKAFLIRKNISAKDFFNTQQWRPVTPPPSPEDEDEGNSLGAPDASSYSQVIDLRSK